MSGRGEVFGKYELIERLATGGMAEVYRAESTSIGGFRKPVALKRILPHLSADAEFVSLFIAEAKLTVALAHGNIVQVFDFGRIDATYFLAMELVEGRDLTRVLTAQNRRGRPAPPEVGLFVTAEVLRGLAHAHGRRDRDGRPLSIVHRDVSPHNVLVSNEGEVKLADFGIATAAAKVSLTRPAMRLGKFAYMSPEQARHEPVDHRADIWAAGVTLWECLTCRRLFFDPDPAVTLARVRAPEVRPPSDLNPAVDARLDQLVLRMLTADVEARPDSARQLASECREQLGRIAPGFDDADLTRFLAELFAEEAASGAFPVNDAPRAPEPRPRADTRADSDVPTRFEMPAASSGQQDPELERLKESFRARPNLWTVVAVGDRLARRGEPASAALFHRLAFLELARAGLRAQAVRQLIRLRELGSPSPELEAEVEAVPRLEGRTAAELGERMDLDDPRLGDLRSFAEEIIGLDAPRPNPREPGLLDTLDGIELARLFGALERRVFAPEAEILREGTGGRELFIITRGRVLIHCLGHHGSRIYLSSLSEGDGFGELGFFTGLPRRATVEALDEVEVLTVSREMLAGVEARFPRLTRALHRHYQRRTVSTLLAKSEIFGALPTPDRQWLVERARPSRRSRGQVILREGEPGETAFVVASGEVEVVSEAGLFLDKLRPGDAFGEEALLTGRPRSASVRALGAVEVLELDRPTFDALLARAPALRELLLAQSRRREAERIRRRADAGPLL